MKKVKNYRYSGNSNLLLLTPISEKIIVNDGVEAIPLLPFDDPSFWRAGSCAAELRYFFSADNYNSLSVMCRPDKGCYITHSSFQNTELVPDSTFVAVKNMTFKKKISLDVCGDYFNFPASAFLPSERAHIVIVDFCGDGARSRSITWCQHPLPLQFEEVYGSPY